MEQSGRPSSTCQAVVIWIDWYAYHLARFKGLQSAFGSNGEVRGIELVGGVGVHKGYAFREGRSEDLPVETLRPKQSWHEASKVGLSVSLLQTLSRADPKLVLVPGYYTLPAIAAALWCKVKGRVSVLMTETTAFDHVRKGWRESLKSWLIRSLFDWAVTGGTAHDRYLLQLGFPRDRIAHFYDVVGNAQIQDGVSALRAGSTAVTHNLPSSYFLFVGRLAPEKNVRALLDSWLAYRAAGGHWSLVLAGDGPESNDLVEQAKGSKDAADVHFLGHRSARELLPVYAFAKAFVLPSTREPWGLVTNEAMAAGLPVIVSDRCGCASDLVLHGENGYLFNPARPDELTARLLELSSSSEAELQRKGQISLDRIADFTPNNFGHEIVAIAKAGRAPSQRPRSGLRNASHTPMNIDASSDRAKLSKQSDQFTVYSASYDQKRSGSPMSRAVEAQSSKEWIHVLSHIDPKYGGLSAVVPRLADQLFTQEEIRTSVAAFCTPEEQREAPQRKRALSTWPMRRLEWVLQPGLRESFRTRVASAEGLHIHGLWENSTLVAACEARRSGVPYVLSAHGMLESWALANKRLKKLIYATLVEHRNTNGAACLHALTRAEAEDYRRFGCKGPIAVIPNGVDAPSATTPRLFLEQYPQADGKRIVLFLGRIHFKKGVELLVRSWAGVAEKFPDALLVLAGPDSENTLAAVSQLVSSLNLDNRVLFTGMLNAAIKWSALAAADFFVLPSYSEGLSVAALEAMSMGVPLILSEHCNLPEVEREGAGWVVQPDEPALTQALTASLSMDRASRQSMGRRARALAQRDFGWPSVTERMAQVYRWVGGGEVPRDVELLWGAHGS